MSGCMCLVVNVLIVILGLFVIVLIVCVEWLKWFLWCSCVSVLRCVCICVGNVLSVLFVYLFV